MHYIVGNSDIVRCFCCDIGLAEWDPEDDPWEEHARHSPNCKFLKEKKGEPYINSVQAEWRKASVTNIFSCISDYSNCMRNQ